MNVQKHLFQLFIVMLFIIFPHTTFGKIIWGEKEFNDPDIWYCANGSCLITKTDTTLTFSDTSGSGRLLSTPIRRDVWANVSEYSVEASFTLDTTSDDAVGIILDIIFEVCGYVFVVRKDQSYTFARCMPNGNAYDFEVLSEGRNSFINPISNRLKVSRKGSDISLFCNDTLVSIHTDTTFKIGNVGIYIGSGQTATFDKFIITDGYNHGSFTTYFTNNFDDSMFHGWAFIEGTANNIVENNNSLAITSNGSYVVMYSSGKYSSAPCTTVVTKVSGDDTKAYGISFMKVLPSQKVVGYNFHIRGDKKNAVYASGLEHKPQEALSITGESDTLIVTANYDFIINGETVAANAFSDKLDFNSVGLYVESGVNIECSMFAAGTALPSKISQEKSYSTFNTNISFPTKGTGVVFDVRGRELIRYDIEKHDNVINLLPAGSYMMMFLGKNNHLVPFSRVIQF